MNPDHLSDLASAPSGKGRFLPILLPFLLTLSCSLGEQGDPGFTRTDSTGIEIVVNHSLPPEDGGGWSLSPDPILSIGAIDGDEAYQLFGLAGMHRLSDGGFGIVNAGSHQVRFYSRDGIFVQAFGQRGGGPDEFEAPALAGSVGDTLIVVDRAHHRLTYVHPSQGFVGLTRVSDEVGGFLNPAGSFADGQTVYGGAFDMRKVGELKNGMNRAGTFYRSSNLDGSLATDFGDKPGAEFFIKDLESEGRDSRPAMTPFAKIPTGAVSPNHFFFSSQNSYEIQVYEPSGQLERLIRLDTDQLPVSASDGERHIEQVVEQVGSPDQEAGIRAQLGSLPLPDFFPPHASIMGDQLDCLWVQDFQRPGKENRSWNIFNPGGVLVARLTLPERFNPTEIGPDYILGQGWDEMDVEYVRLYALTRGITDR